MSPAHGFRGRSVVSAEDFSKEDLLYLLDAATFFERDVGPRLSGRVLGTYLHGPALARNPALADLLLSWVVGALEPLDEPLVDRLRTERLQATLG